MSDKAITAAAQLVRTIEAELARARAELEREILAAGWTELSRHTDTGGRASVTYLHLDREAIDSITGQRASGAASRTFDDFVRGQTT